MRASTKTERPDEEEEEDRLSDEVERTSEGNGNDTSGISSEEAADTSSASSEDESSPDPGYESTSNDETEDDLPDELRILASGARRPLPITPQDDRPDWFDSEKFKLGQQFARKYYFGVNFSDMVSLLFLFLFDDGFVPLMYTDRSSTTFTSFKRYLSTVSRVKSWYECDLWDKNTLGYKNIRTVRAMHGSVAKKMNSSTKTEIMNRVDRFNRAKKLNCPLTDVIRQDVTESLCPYYKPAKKNLPSVFFNQCSMSCTQFGFIGLIVTYPIEFGAGNATDEELEGFIHLWRCIGYLLGIEDRYNFCNGSLDQVRHRSRMAIESWVKPKFFNVTEEWEHFARCLVDGISYYVPGNIYEVVFLYLCWVLNINTPKMNARLTWANYIRLQLCKFTMCVALRVPWVLNKANGLVVKAIHRAENFSREKLESLEKRNDEFTHVVVN